MKQNEGNQWTDQSNKMKLADSVFIHSKLAKLDTNKTKLARLDTKETRPARLDTNEVKLARWKPRPSDEHDFTDIGLGSLSLLAPRVCPP